MRQSTWLLVLAVLGCHDFSLPSQDQRRSVSATCTDPGQCLSGVCQDGYCCEHSCGATEECDLGDQRGTCQPRPKGNKCSTSDQCPSGFCVDGVCCDSACNATCQTCIAGAKPGVCDQAPANTDARRECRTCGACLHGSCGPAEAGTDPNQGCGEGRTCGPGQTCGLVGGAGCKDNAECAVGGCIMGQCLVASMERALAYPMAEEPEELDLRRIVVDEAGEVAISFGERQGYIGVDGKIVEMQDSIFALVRQSTGAWIAASQTILPEIGAQFIDDLTFWNDRLYLSAYVECEQYGPSCGLRGLLYSRTFEVGPSEKLASQVDVAGTNSLLIDGQNNLIASLIEDEGIDYVVHLLQRTSDPIAWTEFRTTHFATPYVRVVNVGGTLLFAFLDFPPAPAPPALELIDVVTGEVVAKQPISSSCSRGTSFSADTFGSGADEGLTLVASCGSYTETTVGTWRPAKPPGSQWTVETVQLRSAVTVRGAQAQALLGYKTSAYSLDFDDALLWWRSSDGAVSTATAFHSSPAAAVWYASACVDREGRPWVAIEAGPMTKNSDGSFAEQRRRIELVRFHP